MDVDESSVCAHFDLKTFMNGPQGPGFSSRTHFHPTHTHVFWPPRGGGVEALSLHDKACVCVRARASVFKDTHSGSPSMVQIVLSAC